MLGNILRGREAFAEAVDAYDEALARSPELQPYHWRLLYARGIALERANRWPRAEKDFLKALEFEPDQPFVLNYLGYSWVEQGKNLDEAQAMIRKAVELRPNDGYIVDSLGWVYYQLGNYEEAVRELERAVELRPEDPVINDHLGDAYWKVGRQLEARFQWKRALGLEPDADLEDQASSPSSTADWSRRPTPRTKSERGSRTEGPSRPRSRPAKINLYLHVIGRRDDGYHLLDSLIAFAAVHDSLQVLPAAAFRLTLTGPFAARLEAEGGMNLVERAARTIAETIGLPPMVAIELTKRLPIAAGIGGGSADAAAAIRALAALWAPARPGADLSDGKLLGFARSLGADVPVCLAGRAALVSGIGDFVRPVRRLPEAGLVLVNPGLPAPTKAVFYRRSGAFSPPSRLDPAAIATLGDAVDLARLLAPLGNDLTDAATGLVPAIGDVLTAIGESEGCLLARLSGSGATCFALFANQEHSEPGAQRLRQQYPGWWIQPAPLDHG